jgi:hypothetical protein
MSYYRQVGINSLPALLYVAAWRMSGFKISLTVMCKLRRKGYREKQV